MYELIILAQLMKHPAHGYLIGRIINDMIGPYARMSNGRLYPLLAKLENAGLIAPYVEAMQKQQNDRQLRSYQITEAGRSRFHELMMDTTSSPGEYQRLFSLKAAYFSFMKPAERLRLIDHYTNYCQTHLHHLAAESEDIIRESENWGVDWRKSWVEDTVNVMQHWSDQWQLEVDWAKQLHEQEIASIHTNSDYVEKKEQNYEL